MLSKKDIKKDIKKLKLLKTWQLLLLFIVFAFISATFLRLNNLGMVERRDAVISADKAGDDEITKARLYELQRYVSTHMNSSLSDGVYLENTYQKDYQEAYVLASKENNIYKAVQEICAPKFSGYSYAYVQCTSDELAKYPAGSDLAKQVSLPQNLYIYNFVSPFWSPDFAGFSVLVCAVVLVIIILRTLVFVILKLLLKRHHYSI